MVVKKRRMKMTTLAEKNDRFALEQAIHVAWSTVDDLKIYIESIDDFEDANASKLDPDSVVNMLMALSEVSDLRFRKLWEVFENFVQYHKIEQRSPEELKDLLRMREEIFERIKNSRENAKSLFEDIEEFGQEKI
jgi:hypothetical protein